MNDIQAELLKDEKVLWSGQPDPSVIFTAADVFLVPFSLLWGGFAIFWEASVIFGFPNSADKPPVFFVIFGMFFVLVGLYFIFGRFAWKNYKKKKTNYFVTNKRIIVLTDAFGRNVQSEFIERIATLNKSVRADGAGTLRFGNSSGLMAMYGNTGMDFFGSFYGQMPLAFYDIKDASKVFDIVNEMRNKQT